MSFTILYISKQKKSKLKRSNVEAIACPIDIFMSSVSLRRLLVNPFKIVRRHFDCLMTVIVKSSRQRLVVTECEISKGNFQISFLKKYSMTKQVVNSSRNFSHLKFTLSIFLVEFYDKRTVYQKSKTFQSIQLIKSQISKANTTSRNKLVFLRCR